MPAVIGHEGDRMIAVQLLDVREGAIFEIISFMDPAVLRFFS